FQALEVELDIGAVAIEEAEAEFVADPEGEVVAEEGAAEGDDQNPDDAELLGGMRPGAGGGDRGDNERGLAGNEEEPEAFQGAEREHGIVAPCRDGVLDDMAEHAATRRRPGRCQQRRRCRLGRSGSLAGGTHLAYAGAVPPFLACATAAVVFACR